MKCQNSNSKMTMLKWTALFLFILQALSIKGIDFSVRIPRQGLQCLQKEGYSFAIIRGSRSNARVDPNLLKNIQAAKEVGMEIDLYIYPCVGKNATAQVYQMINSLVTHRNLVNRVWIDVQPDQKLSLSCDWRAYTPLNNCLYIGEIVKAIQSKKMKVGIYSNKNNWDTIFKKAECNIYKDFPLWYSRYGRGSGQNFNDFQPFGGWKAPYMKQYKGDASVCGYQVDLNWKL